MHYKLLPGTEALIFDLDGTLADSMPLHMKGWKMACGEYGFDMSSEFLRSLTGTPAKVIARLVIEHYGVSDKVSPDELLTRKTKSFYSFQSQVKEIKPVADIAREYKGKIPMAVGTGGFREAAMRTMEAIGMTSFFNVIVTSDDVTNHKPHPETFLKCAELLGVDPSRITVFEDGDLGIEAAQRAGMNAVDIRPWHPVTW